MRRANFDEIYSSDAVRGQVNQQWGYKIWLEEGGRKISKVGKTVVE